LSIIELKLRKILQRFRCWLLERAPIYSECTNL